MMPIRLNLTGSRLKSILSTTPRADPHNISKEQSMSC
jgi:hypothetical protein